MEELLKQIVEKISSYNIFNNLYPGILFIYLLKFIFEINLLSDNWLENLIVFYFVGMVLSRIGSIIIEPIMKKIKLIKYAPYSDYVKASSIEPLVDTLSEVNNTYRTLLSPLIDLLPRIVTRVLPPTPEALRCIFTPATFPFRLLTKLASFTEVKASLLTFCTL